jgi:hypothetical protein
MAREQAQADFGAGGVKAVAAEGAAQAQADGWAKDDALARGKGAAPEQVEARRRVARMFCEIHLAEEKAEDRGARLAGVDYGMPVATVNGRGVDVGNPKGKGFLGMGRKPAYWVSERFAPKGAEDPIYALEYYPVKR